MAEHTDAAIIDRIYEAAVVPEQWPGVLDALADIAGAEGTVLIASDMQNLRWISSDAILPFVDGFLNGDWAQKHTRLWKLLEANHAGFIREDDVYTREEYDNDVFINGLLKPLGLGWATATAIQVPTGDSLVFSIERRFDRGPVEREAIRRLDDLRPHLARASLMAARLGLERARVASEALGLVGLPAAVLGRHGRLLAANDLFERSASGALRETRAGLAFTDGTLEALYRRSLHQLETDTAGRVLSIPVPAREERPAMVVHLIPVRGAARDIFSTAVCVVLITPVSTAAVPSAEVIQGLFDLTPAEARVARQIAAGRTIGEAAAAGNVSDETVRVQLKSVFAKTGVSRQAELVGLLSGLAVRP